MAEHEKPEYRYFYDSYSQTGIVERKDGKTTLRYTGRDAQRLRKVSPEALAREMKSQYFS